MSYTRTISHSNNGRFASPKFFRFPMLGLKHGVVFLVVCEVVSELGECVPL